MELELQREILRLRPKLSIKEVEAKAQDIFYYWLDNCLEDVLEASE